jgi:hypothetical protein
MQVRTHGEKLGISRNNQGLISAGQFADGLDQRQHARVG